MEEKMEMAEYWKHFSVDRMEETLQLCREIPAELLMNLTGIKGYLEHLMDEKETFLAESEKAWEIAQDLLESNKEKLRQITLAQINLEEFLEEIEGQIKEVKKAEAEEETKKEKMIRVQLQLGGLA